MIASARSACQCNGLTRREAIARSVHAYRILTSPVVTGRAFLLYIVYIVQSLFNRASRGRFRIASIIPCQYVVIPHNKRFARVWYPTITCYDNTWYKRVQIDIAIYTNNGGMKVDYASIGG
jgi:hypothetical protein